MDVTTYHNILKLTRELDTSDQLRLLEALAEQVRRQVESPSSHSILELEGLGAEIWHGMDAQQYVDEERASWDF